MDTLELLLAEREITRALVRFARAMDERDWAALDEILLEDATADYGLGLLEGREAIVGIMRRFLDGCGPTQHLIGNVLIEIDGDTAQSRAYVNDRHVGLDAKSHLSFATLGDYRDQWRRVDGVWRMSNRTKIDHAHVGDISVLGDTV